LRKYGWDFQTSDRAIPSKVEEMCGTEPKPLKTGTSVVH
jgi:hypothetical protein